MHFRENHIIKGIQSWLGAQIASYLTKPLGKGDFGVPANLKHLEMTLKVGDVLLVEGRTRVGSTIKYLTQSTWSHAALYVGELLHQPSDHVLIEADMQEGVRSLPLSFYEDMHTRICRPRDLTPEECTQVALYAISKLGNTYDLRHIVDLLRYTLPKVFFKPDMGFIDALEFGSGDPTRAICSSLIAEAFYSVRYPVLAKDGLDAQGADSMKMPHHTLFTPRDFDVSPFFDVIKPSSWVSAEVYRPHLKGYVNSGFSAAYALPNVAANNVAAKETNTPVESDKAADKADGTGLSINTVAMQD